MVTDDYLLDDLERSQLDVTNRRRWNRSRRYYQLLLVSVGLLALFVLAAPSLISHTGIARSMLASRAAEYGWTASAESINVGWITPLSIKELELVGGSGETAIKIGRADTALTVTDLLALDLSAVGEISVRGVTLACTVQEGESSLESDLSPLLTPSDPSETPVRATIQIQDAGATITDSMSGQSWVLSQSNVNVAIDGPQIKGDIAGVVNEPSGSGGAIQSHFVWQDSGVSVTKVSAAGNQTADPGRLWELSIDTESFPLSVTDLISRRFAGQIAGLPQHLAGDTTGKLKLFGGTDGSLQADLGDIQIRNLKTVETPRPNAPMTNGLSESAVPRQWNNQLATLDGRVAYSSGWLMGEGLKITTDFASATLDGSFPTTISLVGSNDNPLSWLQALDGKARLDVDLASLDRALPGLIPLRRDVTLVSGRARGIIENTPDTEGGTPANRRSNLSLSSESLRARADGRIVVIDPIELTATVTDDNGSLRADRFSMSSSFAKASGSGTLQDGMAEVQIDFGRLYTMLRPVIDLSELSLGGTAGGELKWNVKRTGDGNADQWDLGGTGEAKNLLVTLPSGHRFKRSIVQGDIVATGQWDGRTLRQLSIADVSVRSGGVSMRAELLSPVANPTADSLYSIRLESDGRLENLSESLRPWLPESLLGAEGRLTGSAIASVSRSGGSLSRAEFVVNQPRINYANKWYTQPQVTVKFDGIFDWPSGNFASQELTVTSEAMTLAVRGEAIREKTNLDLAWNADLQRLQQSIGSTIARAASTSVARPISYRPVQQNEYSAVGLCTGKMNITGGPVQWKIDSSMTGSNLAIYSPASQRNLPPATYGQGFRQPDTDALGDLLWQEPRLKIDGFAEYNADTATLRLPETQISSDGFAATLDGVVVVANDKITAKLNGPARWKMDVLASRLSNLFGTPIRAAGIHDGPFQIQFTSSATQPIAVDVKAELGWDRCDLAGLSFGETSLPIEMTERNVKLSRITMPILSLNSTVPNSGSSANLAPVGQTTFSAQVDYASTPMTVRLDPGASVDSLQITPATAAGWLKYLTPLAANSASIDGRVSAKFDEALIVVDNLDASVVRGSLEIQDLRLSSGPLANQLIQGVQQIKSIARLTGGSTGPIVAEPAGAKTLIQMPPQSVDFSFENGVATHQRMYFQIDRANVMTSGRVSTDSSLNLVAHIPLDASWLGSDLKGLAGQTMTFPIAGTLSRPSLDDSAIRNVMAELGTKAGAQVIQNRLDGLIQKQLGSGMDQINSGLEKILGF